MVEDTRFPPDVQVKKGFSWSEQLGIAIAALVEGGEQELVDWLKDVGSLSHTFWANIDLLTLPYFGIV
jgi:replication fork protection complex subunit Tof1/Swi1